jgi:hypothetical protein
MIRLRDMLEVIEVPSAVNDNPRAMKLLKKMLDENLEVIEPVFVPSARSGYCYPGLENYLKLNTEETNTLLDSLVKENILEKRLSSTFLSCPGCGSSLIQSVLGCPRCEKDTVSRGRILEHFYCGSVNLEDDYIVQGKYVCPKCKKEVKYLGTDYRSVGVRYSCHSCGNIFDEAIPLRKCQNCSKLFMEQEAAETAIYSFRLLDDQKFRLDFEFGVKQRLIDFLGDRGYSVTEKARIARMSKSGEQHVFDLIARRFDGLIDYVLCVDFVISSKNHYAGLEDVFKFDNKAYDLAVHDKILVAVPGLSDKAKKFAKNQRIVALSMPELEGILNTAGKMPGLIRSDRSVEFKNKADLLSYLAEAGYTVEERARIKGRSGVLHLIDIYASIYDGIVPHIIDIGIMEDKSRVNIDQVFSFDTKAFDIGAHDKILFTAESFDDDAKLFAQHQNIKIYRFKK